MEEEIKYSDEEEVWYQAAEEGNLNKLQDIRLLNLSKLNNLNNLNNIKEDNLNNQENDEFDNDNNNDNNNNEFLLNQLDERTCYLASRWGHLHVLKWLHSLNLPCLTHDLTWYSAIEGGHLNVIIWMKENGYFHWVEKSCYVASETNNLEILTWLRSQTPSCPWNKDDCEAIAQEYGNFELLEWIRKH
mmetsp:Transcript_10914/g.11333  ORF Transcript_10914/g.11333 Transcript_10914/m.11333 type:complete len:188 (+) Transcript_10914:43-606(+)